MLKIYIEKPKLNLLTLTIVRLMNLKQHSVKYFKSWINTNSPTSLCLAIIGFDQSG